SGLRRLATLQGSLLLILDLKSFQLFLSDLFGKAAALPGRPLLCGLPPAFKPDHPHRACKPFSRERTEEGCSGRF
ncbi:MAG TPA: hypothetical protein VIJ36_17970, partial [Thermoanaerobaculia bacterium]